jgi:hypothetical protein
MISRPTSASSEPFERPAPTRRDLARRRPDWRRRSEYRKPDPRLRHDVPQGARTTVHQSFVLVRDTIEREYAYSGLSHGTEANSIYLADHGPRIEEQHAPELESHALDRLGRGLQTSSAKSMARDLNDGLGLER